MTDEQYQRNSGKIQAMLEWLVEHRGKIPHIFKLGEAQTVIDSGKFVDVLHCRLVNYIENKMFGRAFMSTYMKAYELKIWYEKNNNNEQREQPIAEAA